MQCFIVCAHVKRTDGTDPFPGGGLCFPMTGWGGGGGELSERDK